MAFITLSPNPDKEKKTSKTGNHTNNPNGQWQRCDNRIPLSCETDNHDSPFYSAHVPHARIENIQQVSEVLTNLVVGLCQ